MARRARQRRQCRLPAEGHLRHRNLYGAVDHIALNVTDIESVFAWINASETYQSLDAEIQQLPFFERGVRFFRISGPNGETVEFNQIL